VPVKPAAGRSSHRGGHHLPPRYRATIAASTALPLPRRRHHRSPHHRQIETDAQQDPVEQNPRSAIALCCTASVSISERQQSPADHHTPLRRPDWARKLAAEGHTGTGSGGAAVGSSGAGGASGGGSDTAAGGPGSWSRPNSSAVTSPDLPADTNCSPTPGRPSPILRPLDRRIGARTGASQPAIPSAPPPPEGARMLRLVRDRHRPWTPP